MTDPSLSDVLREATAAATGLLHTSLPGVVLDYNRTEQTAKVRLVVRGRRKLVDGGFEVFERAPLVRVPIVWPGGGAGALTFDLEAGDPVVVVFAERDVSRWLVTGRAPSDPVDSRTHDLSDGYAIPQVRPYADPLPGTAVLAGAAVLSADDIRLGSSAAAQFIALAPLVLAELQKVSAWMTSMNTTFSTHTHGGVTTGAGVSAVPVPVPGLPPTPPSFDSPASTKVRSE